MPGAKAEGKAMCLWCLVEKPKEEQCCCGAWCKNLRKTNVVAVSGVTKTKGKLMCVRCLVHNPKEKQCYRGVCRKIRNSSNNHSCSNKSGMDNVNVFSCVNENFGSKA